MALILGSWGLGSVVVAGRTLVRVGRFGRLVARGEAADEATWAEVAAVAERLGARAPGSVRTVPGLSGPLVWCPGRPVLVLPEGFERLPSATRSSLLAHELAHLARGDHWVARLEMVAGLLWWWNPVFRLARVHTRRLAEAACDARVVRAYPESRFAYAEALVVASASTRPRVAPPLPALGSGDAARTLEARLTMILRDPARPPSRWPRPLAAALVALALPSWTLARQDPAPASSSPPPAPAPSPASEAPRPATSSDPPTPALAAAPTPARADDPARVDRRATAVTELARVEAEGPPPPGRPSAAILQARRDAQAAELARAAAGLKVAEAVTARNESLNKRIPNSVSREDVRKVEAEADLARATVDRERARLAEADIALAEAQAEPAASPPSVGTGAGLLPGVLRARRQAQAAELARAEANRRMAEIKLAQTAKLASGPSPAVSKSEVALLQGELDREQATVDRETAKLAEVDALIADARSGSTFDGEGEPTPRPRTLVDLRDQAELLELQIAGKRSEVDFARTNAGWAAATLENRVKLRNNNAISLQELHEGEHAAEKARLELSGREGELRQLELRLKQTRARIERETTSLRRQAERFRARLDWSRSMLVKGYVGRDNYEKARGEYDDLMFQLDPNYKPEPEPRSEAELKPEPPAEVGPPAPPGR